MSNAVSEVSLVLSCRVVFVFVSFLVVKIADFVLSTGWLAMQQERVKAVEIRRNFGAHSEYLWVKIRG